MSEIYCIDCEREIKLPMFAISTTETKPVKYKQGYRCGACDRKKQEGKK